MKSFLKQFNLLYNICYFLLKLFTFIGFGNK